MKRWLAASPLLFVLALHCSDPSGGAGSASPSTSASGSAATATATVAAATGKIGVAACDTYIAKQRALLSGVPEAERSGRVTAVDAIESTWLQQSKSVDDPARLTRSCEASLAALEGDAKPAPAPATASATPSASASP